MSSFALIIFHFCAFFKQNNIEVASLSSNWYSNDCYKSYGNNNQIADTNQQVYLKEIEKQREILAEDDIIDSSSDDDNDGMEDRREDRKRQKMGMTMSQQRTVVSTVATTTTSNYRIGGTQDSGSKSEIIVIDSD